MSAAALSKRVPNARHLPAVRSNVALGLMLTAAGALWIASLLGARLEDMAGLGLLQALPWTYYAALVLLLAGFASALGRLKLPERLLGLYVSALILVLHATAPLLYAEPRYAYVYKHIGVANLIAATGQVDRAVDIYNNWPGLFAGGAWLSLAGDLPPIAFAGWAEVFFGFANVAALQFALRGLTRDRRLVWGATWLFVLGNWIGQDYFAPQALAFLLLLAIMGLCLRAGFPAPPSRTRLGRRRDTRLLRLGVGPHSWAGEPLALGRRAAVALIVLLYVAVVTTHQITPVVLIVAVSLLALIKRVPLWLPALLAAIEVAWFVLAWPFMATHFEIVAFDPLARPPMPARNPDAPPMALFELTGAASLGIFALFALLAAAGGRRRWKAGGRDLAPLAFVVAPVLVVTAQAYNGEGSMRAFLFSLPALSYFAAAAVLPPPSWRMFAAGLAAGVCLLPAFFGREYANHFTPGEVRASTWLDRHAPAGTLVMYLAGANFPDRLTARYAQLRGVYEGNYEPSLSDLPGFPRRRLGPRDVPAIERVLEERSAARVWFVLNPAQERYSRLFGVFPPGTTTSLARALDASPAFRTVYRRDGVWIFDYEVEGSRP